MKVKKLNKAVQRHNWPKKANGGANKTLNRGGGGCSLSLRLSLSLQAARINVALFPYLRLCKQVEVRRQENQSVQQEQICRCNNHDLNLSVRILCRSPSLLLLA